MSIYQDRTKKYIGIVTTTANAGDTATVTLTPLNDGYYWYDPNWNILTGTMVGSSSFSPSLPYVVPGTKIPLEGTRAIYRIKKGMKLSLFDFIMKEKLKKEGRLEEID